MKNDQPEWTYRTQHVDVMLWQYCQGLFDLMPYLDTEKRIKVFDQLVAAKIVKIKAAYNLDPSFTVTMVMTENGTTSFEMKKIPVS